MTGIRARRPTQATRIPARPGGRHRLPFPAGLALACLLATAATAADPAGTTATPPYTIEPDLFDPAQPDDLGLVPAPGTRTATVFAPTDADHFNNGVVLVGFQGHLYAQWQSSARDEDSPDTRVLYSRSEDGLAWSPPRELVPAGAGARMHSSGGWWTDGRTLVAFVNVWPNGFQSGDGGNTAYLDSRDGATWSAMRPVQGVDGQPVAGVIEQDPHALPDGRLVTAFHLQPGLLATPHFTDDPLGVGGWTPGAMPRLPREGTQSRELEPSVFVREGCVVMVFRDQASSHRQLAAESCDRGATWTRPVLTGMPDSRSKQSAGNLPDGTAFLVNAPNAGKPRIPLAITLSDDGRHFDRAFLLRGGRDLQPLRTAGRYKRPGYHYPKSVVWNGALWVGYATNKEDVQVTRVPLGSLVDDRAR